MSEIDDSYVNPQAPIEMSESEKKLLNELDIDLSDIHEVDSTELKRQSQEDESDFLNLGIRPDSDIGDEAKHDTGKRIGTAPISFTAVDREKLKLQKLLDDVAATDPNKIVDEGEYQRVLREHIEERARKEAEGPGIIEIQHQIGLETFSVLDDLKEDIKTADSDPELKKKVQEAAKKKAELDIQIDPTVIKITQH